MPLEPEVAVSDEPVQTAPETAQATQVAPVSIIGENGQFTDGWKETLPEDIRNEVCLNTVTDVSSMAKQFVHAQRMIGKDKIVVPKEGSPEADWEAFYIAAGRPETAGDYNLKRPEELPEEYFSQDLANKAQDLFYKIGLSKKQADALMAFNTSNTLSALKDKENAEELAEQTAHDALNEKWGNAKPQRMHLGNVAINEAAQGDEGFQKQLSEAIGTNAILVEAFSNLGAKFAEHSAPEVAMIPTPGDYDEKIREITNTPEYIGGNEIPKAIHDAAVAKVNRLFEEKLKQKSAG